MRQIFSKQEVTAAPFDCAVALEDLRKKEKLRDDFDSDISTYEFNLQSMELSIKVLKEYLKKGQDSECGDIEKAQVEEARVTLAFLSYPCYNSFLTCPLLFYNRRSLNFKLEEIKKCVATWKVTNFGLGKFGPPWAEDVRGDLKQDEKTSKDLRETLNSWRTLRSKLLGEITDLNFKITQADCYGTLPFIKNNTKLTECNKSKERIEKLKNKYFKLSKDMLDIKFGLKGIKFLKLNKKYLIEIKLIIEELIKKGEDVKRYVIETDDEKAFLTLHSSNKAKLAQNIKEQSVTEANLKNLLIKKEKTNIILKRTKKLLDLKIKQTIKFCNDRK
jgi:hypothetical protein